MGPERVPWEEIEQNLYWYRGQVTKIYDGDSPTITVDLGFGTSKPETKFRLLFVDTEELRGVSDEKKKLGRAARDYVCEKIPVGSEVIVHTYKSKSGKYGRWIAEVWYKDEELGEAVNLGVELVSLGHGKIAYNEEGSRI